ncbi:MAG TPA: sigma-70 family RNA polymerase sigma factor [Planctomycetota bacterium]
MTLRSDWDQWLGAARGGDVQALGRLVEAASEDLRGIASTVLGRSARAHLCMQADDVFSDALIAAMREIGRLRATNYIGFRYWFATIARNHVRRSLRDRRARAEKRPEPEDEPHVEDDEVLIVTTENAGLVRHALAQLPRSQQVAFVLRQGFGLAWRTIGFVLEHRDPSAARLVHYRALSAVKGVVCTRPEVRGLVIQA